MLPWLSGSKPTLSQPTSVSRELPGLVVSSGISEEKAQHVRSGPVQRFARHATFQAVVAIVTTCRWAPVIAVDVLIKQRSLHEGEHRPMRLAWRPAPRARLPSKIKTSRRFDWPPLR